MQLTFFGRRKRRAPLLDESPGRDMICLPHFPFPVSTRTYRKDCRNWNRNRNKALFHHDLVRWWRAWEVR